jgi:DNA-binding LacI/PurR family transcriptional regulator
MHQPSLTTIPVGGREIGEETARLVVRGNNSAKGRRKQYLVTKLVFSSSRRVRSAI